MSELALNGPPQRRLGSAAAPSTATSTGNTLDISRPVEPQHSDFTPPTKEGRMTVTTISSSPEGAEVMEDLDAVELPLAAAKVLYRMIADIHRQASEQDSEAA
jgi:hypothetical protein